MKHPEIIALVSVWAIILIYIAYLFVKISRNKEYRTALDKKAEEKKAKKKRKPKLSARIDRALGIRQPYTDMYGNIIDREILERAKRKWLREN